MRSGVISASMSSASRQREWPRGIHQKPHPQHRMASSPLTRSHWAGSRSRYIMNLANAEKAKHCVIEYDRPIRLCLQSSINIDAR